MKGRDREDIKRTGEEKRVIDLCSLCHIRLKIAGDGLVFSVFLWDLFSCSLLYCDSCSLPVRITSPGTHSSSRAHRVCRPTPFPLDGRTLCISIISGFEYVHVIARLYKVIKRKVIFCPRYLFPLDR